MHDWHRVELEKSSGENEKTEKKCKNEAEVTQKKSFTLKIGVYFMNFAYIEPIQKWRSLLGTKSIKFVIKISGKFDFVRY